MAQFILGKKIFDMYFDIWVWHMARLLTWVYNTEAIHQGAIKMFWHVIYIYVLEWNILKTTGQIHSQLSYRYSFPNKNE